jgi:hypothetical protein
MWPESEALAPTWERADVSNANAGRGGYAEDQYPPLPGLACARLGPPPRWGEGNVLDTVPRGATV